MGPIKLHNQFHPETTIVSNTFIDKYMPGANGTFVKVYLYLLRHLHCTDELSVDIIAEELDETEKDINRALSYWENQKLLNIIRSDEQAITDISILDFYEEIPAAAVLESTGSSESFQEPLAEEPPDTVSSDPLQPNYTKAQIAVLIEVDEIKWLMGSIEQYLERLLKPADIQLILYLYEGLSFSSELILYLYEYCISLNKKSLGYIKAVALSWAEEGIDTVEKAEEAAAIYNKGFQIVCKAFGINRMLGSAEKQFINKWFQVYKFDSSVVEEALSRTLLAAGKPDFKYADKIMASWHKKEVKQLNDIKELDKEHQKTNCGSPAKRHPEYQASPNNKFNAFPQRSHTTEYYESLEKHLLNKN